MCKILHIKINGYVRFSLGLTLDEIKILRYLSRLDVKSLLNDKDKFIESNSTQMHKPICCM